MDSFTLGALRAAIKMVVAASSSKTSEAKALLYSSIYANLLSIRVRMGADPDVPVAVLERVRLLEAAAATIMHAAPAIDEAHEAELFRLLTETVKPAGHV